jgi:hypothetical protein
MIRITEKSIIKNNIDLYLNINNYQLNVGLDNFTQK